MTVSQFTNHMDMAAALESREQRGLLDIIDALRSQGLTRYIDLPQIIVCGDQSSGKSSVLEAISGIDFPTKDGLCTRFATELILRRSELESIRVHIIPDHSRIEQERLALSRVKLVAEGCSVGAAIDKARMAMDDISAHSANFFSDVLRVEISGPTQPHLTMVDLPGLFLASNNAQSSVDAKLVQNMVISYMKKPRSIILAVVSASNEFVLQQVTQRARELDVKGERTLGLITKPDKLDFGSEGERSYLELAKNRSAELALGWHVLRNRTYAESHSRSELRDRREQEFFQQEPWASLPNGQKGVGALRSRLSAILRDQILLQLPNVISDIKAGLAGCKAQLGRLGTARSTLSEQRAYLLKSSQEFTTLVAAAIDGSYSREFFQNVDDNAARLRAIVQRELTSFAETMRIDGQKYKIVNRASGSAKANEITREVYLQNVKKVVEDYRGVELPGTVNPAVIKLLFRDQSEPWKEIAYKTMHNIASAAEALLCRALDTSVAGTTKNLVQAKLVGPAFEKICHELKKVIDNFLEPYISGHPITYNHYLTDNIQRAQAERNVRQLKMALCQCIPGIRFDGTTVNVNLDGRTLLNSIGTTTEPNMEMYTCQQAVDTMEAYYKVRSFRYGQTQFHLMFSRWPSRLLQIRSPIMPSKSISFRSFATSSRLRPFPSLMRRRFVNLLPRVSKPLSSERHWRSSR